MANALTEAMDAAREAVFNEHFDAVAAAEALYRVLAVIEEAASPSTDDAEAQQTSEQES